MLEQLRADFRLLVLSGLRPRALRRLPRGSPKKVLDASADVVILGGGGAGLRAAIAIAEENPTLDVAVLSKVYRCAATPWRLRAVPRR